MNKTKVIKRAVKHYGKDNQLSVCIEELSELIKELCKDKRGQANADHIAEEMADVCIMLGQLSEIYQNTDAVNDWIIRKLLRLQIRMDAEDSLKGVCRCSQRRGHGHV